MGSRAAALFILAWGTLALAACYDLEPGMGGDGGATDAATDARHVGPDAAHHDAAVAGPDVEDTGLDMPDAGADAADSGFDAADSGPDAADAGPDITDAGPDAGGDAGCPNTVDDRAKLPAGVTPPTLWFWRGINQSNLDWYTDAATGNHCANGDTTMWYVTPSGHCGGAPSCDPDHFGTPDAPCTGTDCCWRNWDDPRGPEFRVTNNTGPVSVVNWGARLSTGGKAEGYGFEVTVCAAPGTTAFIDTCPRCDVHSCVEDNYPQFVDECDPVRLPVKPPKAPYPPESAGCYSTINDITIQF